MESNNIISAINILLIVAIAQGLFISILLFHKHRSLYPNRFLGFLMLIFSLSLVHIYLEEQKITDMPLATSLLSSVIFLLGPLHYLYTKYLVHQPRKFNARQIVHFIPALLLIAIILFMSLGNSDLDYSKIFLQEQASGFIIINWLFIAHVFFYYLLTILELKWYSVRIKDIFSSIDKIRLNWLQLLTFLAFAVVGVFLIENILNLMHSNITEFHMSSAIGAVYVYSMGYIGISKSTIFSHHSLKELASDLPDDYSSENSIKVKYERSGLSEESLAKYAKELLHLMEKKEVYRQSNLTLQQLSEMLDISTHHLSQIINSQFNKNFFDFVNQYRVDQVIKDLESNEKNHLTLLAIGLDAGFNSKTTFNTIFKKFTGKTPSQFKS